MSDKEENEEHTMSGASIIIAIALVILYAWGSGYLDAAAHEQADKYAVIEPIK